MRYSSIKTLPVATFQEILATGNYRLLGPGTDAQLETAWASIFDEYIKEFGLSESYKSYVRHMAKAIAYYNKAYNQGYKFAITLAEVEKAKAKMQLVESTGNGFTMLVAQVSKGMGFRVDPNSTSVAEFYSYLKLLENGIREGKN